ncbi:MAG: hypothetical protein ABIH23_04160, partial [bacterium]
MIDALLDSGFLWKCVWQTTLLLSLGLGLSYFFSRRPARAHRILLLALVACVVAPFVGHAVSHFGWGFLRSQPHVVSSPERVILPVPTP